MDAYANYPKLDIETLKWVLSYLENERKNLEEFEAKHKDAANFEKVAEKLALKKSVLICADNDIRRMLRIQVDREEGF